MMQQTADEMDQAAQQRALLTCLDQLTTMQEHALNSGDLPALNQLSEERARVVREAALFVPPCAEWDPRVVDLALHVKARSENLQNEVRACMAAVRRELVALTKRSQVTHYLASGTARRGAAWRA